MGSISPELQLQTKPEPEPGITTQISAAIYFNPRKNMNYKTICLFEQYYFLFQSYILDDINIIYVY